MSAASTLLFYVLPPAAFLYLFRLILDYRRAIVSVGSFPGFRHFLRPNTIVTNAIPWYVPGVCCGRSYVWRSKHKDFDLYDSDITTIVSLSPYAHVHINVADADVVKEITSHRARWVKPVEQYSAILQFGGNIVASEGDEWKKHWKIANPAFSEPNNKLVWEEAVRITMDMIENVWKNGEEVRVNNAVDITLPLALFIIGSAGFGRTISFADDSRVPPDQKMSFKDALGVFSRDMILGLVFPRWTMSFTARLAQVRDAIDDLKKYIKEMINERRVADKRHERHDLFSSLLNANTDEGQDGRALLTDEELTGDIFLFLLAGHESTAYTLCFTFGLLALYPGQQDILYRKIVEVLPNGRLPKYDDLAALQHVLHVFYETLRLFPPATIIPKNATEDTTLITTRLTTGEKLIVPVPKNATITIHAPGLHYNPRYWDDPHAFKPERFAGDWPRDAFIPFSAGARSCIGRRFSESEAVPIISLIIARYRVEVLKEPQFETETFEQRRERVLACEMNFTLTPTRLPLVFKRR